MPPPPNIPSGRFLNHFGPRLIQRDVIPRRPLPQLVPGPQAHTRSPAILAAGVNINTIVIELRSNLCLQKIVLFLNWSPCWFSLRSAQPGTFSLHRYRTKLVAIFFTKCGILERTHRHFLFCNFQTSCLFTTTHILTKMKIKSLKGGRAYGCLKTVSLVQSF